MAAISDESVKTRAAATTVGAVLAIAWSYLALIAWHRSHQYPLTNVPVTNLAELLVSLPVIAPAAAWLVAGREPQAIGHHRLHSRRLRCFDGATGKAA
ncbi:MAG: hypothetical protein ACRDZ8_21640 [Acidimicrobiales bacterium]